MSIIQYFRTNFNFKRNQKKYKISDFNLNTPPDYLLKYYQDKHRLYDRFLPFFLKRYKFNGSIIDIGANIGDTLASIYLETNNEIFCIEPSSYFMKYLSKNVEVIENNNDKKVKIINRFIGSGSLNTTLVHKDGSTATQQFSENDTIVSVTLDELFFNKQRVDFIKSDIDGFDYDAILSGKQLIKENLPIIFFENQIDFNEQISGYQNMYKMLEEIGYNNFVIFDNFGNILFEDVTLKKLLDLNYYLYSLKKGYSTRTVYYFDILAYSDLKHHNVKSVIDLYKSDMIFNIK
jgi:FkbM family methyltransferase